MNSGFSYACSRSKTVEAGVEEGGGGFLQLRVPMIFSTRDTLC